MNIQKIIIYSFIIYFFLGVNIAGAVVDNFNMVNKYYTVILNKIGTRSIDEQILILNKLESKISNILSKKMSNNNKILLTKLNLLISIKSKQLIKISEHQKNIVNVNTGSSANINTGVTNIVTNKSMDVNSNTGSLINTGIVFERKKLDMLKEFNQIVSQDNYYNDFFTSGSLAIPEQNKIVVKTINDVYNFYTLDYSSGSYVYIGTGGINPQKIENNLNLYKKEDLENAFYFYIKQGNDFYSNKFFIIPSKFYDKYKIPDSITKLPIDLFSEDIYRDKYDMQTRIKYLKEIDNNTQAIIRGKNSDFERIKAIYSWMTDNNNITYDYKKLKESESGTGVIRTDQSGLATYKLKTGVCAGIAKLFVYMLHFADIKDVEYTVGHTFSGNFGFKTGHAWVKVGDYYYDPTWDLYSKERDRFFRLPRDLLYATRSDKDDPNYSYYAGLNQAQLDKLMEDNYRNLIPKYKDKYYYHLQPYLYLEAK